MLAELGLLACIIALVLLLPQGLLAGRGLRSSSWFRVVAFCARSHALLLLFAVISLMVSFYLDDFSVRYVAQHGHRQMPNLYKLTAVWGAHEGSFLLWVFLLACCKFVFSYQDGGLTPLERAVTWLALSLSQVGFLSFLLWTSNPFARLWPWFPPQGGELNPLLQDPLLAIHPPVLYLGYVGFAVVFGLCMGALACGKVSKNMLKLMNFWSFFSWGMLTLGIVLGSFWAYYELGWGGWWFWDPVENASFMPWLVGVALIHALSVCSKQGKLEAWVVLLGIVAFGFSLLGTFLVRSGVITSVHAFAHDPLRGLFILLLFGAIVGGGLVFFATRVHRLTGLFSFQFNSTPALLLWCNLVFIASSLMVFLGTLYPLMMDWVGGYSMSVGAGYFNRLFVPLMFLALPGMAMAAVVHWGGVEKKSLLRLISWPVVSAGVLGFVWCQWLAGEVTLGAWLITSLAWWLLVAMLFVKAAESKPSWAMRLAHAGFAVTMLGMSAAVLFEDHQLARMKPGDRVMLGSRVVSMLTWRQLPGPNYDRDVVDFLVEGDPPRILSPEKHAHPRAQVLLSETAIHAGFAGDTYLALGDEVAGSWTIRMHYYPMVRWIWAGGFLMFVAACLKICRFNATLQRQTS